MELIGGAALCHRFSDGLVSICRTVSMEAGHDTAASKYLIRTDSHQYFDTKYKISERWHISIKYQPGLFDLDKYIK